MLVWIVPVVTLLLVATNEQHHLHWSAIDEVMTPLGRRLVYQRRHLVLGARRPTATSSILIGTATLVRGLRRFPPPYRRQTALIILGAIVPWIGNLLYLSRALPVTGLDLTPIAFTVSGACFTFGIYRYRLFGLVPVARDMVVDSMDDGVIVLDAQRRLVDLNAAAERYTGCIDASLGRPIDEVVAWWTEAVDEDRPLAEGQPAIVKVEPGPRYFEVKVSAVRDSQRRFVGWLVIIHDVSNRRRNEAERYAFERRLQEQQKSESLMVLAGGVAHDFNNLLTGILGNADLLAILSPPESDAAPRRRGDRDRRAARRRSRLEDARLLRRRPCRGPTRRPRRARQGDGRSAGRLGRAPLHADLQQPRRRCRSSKPIRRKSARSCST